MTDYVAGFAFDPSFQQVLLIRKTHPGWQAGKLNGVGGRIEPADANSYQAMAREFAEETGIATISTDWRKLLVLDSGPHRIEFFRTVLDEATIRAAHGQLSDTGETLEVHRVAAVHAMPDKIPNLSWIVPLAAYTHDGYTTTHVLELDQGERQNAPDPVPHEVATG